MAGKRGWVILSKVEEPGQSSRQGDRVGLCLTCQHTRRTESDRGSLFYRCALAESDPRFPKYPRLPVLKCSGFKPQ